MINENDEDVMFQDAAQSLIDARTTTTTDNTSTDGGMPGDEGQSDAATTTTDTAPAADQVNTEAQTATTTATTDTPAATATAAIEPINFEGISGGLVKTPEDVTRISNEFRVMQQELTTLREQQARDPFANEFVKSLNQMHADGKSATQIETFIQLQNLGDISKLAPLDAMVQARVLRDGREAELVKVMLERKYGITEGMDELDRRIAEDAMLEDAKPDYDYLKNEKKELATPVSQTNVDTTTATTAISLEEIRSQVAPIKDKVKEHFTSLGEINLNGKFGQDGKPAADAILFNLPIPAEFKEQVPGILEGYFVNSNLPVTPENMETAMGILQYEMYQRYGVKIIQDAVNHATNIVDRRVRDEYENKNQQQQVHQPTNRQTLTDAQLEKYATGE